MKTAKEMFEELGYKCIEHNTRTHDEYALVPQDEPYIEYIAENNNLYLTIKFCLWNRTVWTEMVEINANKPYKRFPCPLNYKDFLAINKQLKELRWDEEHDKKSENM